METIKINIDTNAPKATDNMKTFRNEIKELRSQLIGLTEGTEDYNKVLGELANKQFQMREMNENVRYSVTDLGEQLGTVSRIASGVASGFSAVQATMTLFGAESENLEKTMVKLQSAIALVQGLQGLEDLGKQLGRAKIQFSGTIRSVKGFITSLSGVKKALLGTGIGVFIVLLGTLAANWDKVTSAVDRFINKESGAEKAIKNLSLAQKSLTEEVSFYNDERERENEILLASGATQKEILERNLKASQENYSKQQKIVEDAYKQYNLLNNRYNQGAVGIKKEDVEKAKTVYDEAVKLASEYEKEVNNVKHKIRVEDAKLAKQAQDEEQKRREQAQADEQKRLEKAQAEKAALLKKAQDINEDARISLIDTEEEELAELERVYLEEKALLESQGVDTANLTDKYEKDITAIEKKYADERVELAEKAAEKQFAIAKAQYEGQISTLEAAVSDIQTKFDIDSIKKELAEGDLFNFKFETPEEEFNRIKQFNQDVYNSTLEILKAEEEQLNAQLSMYAVGTAERIELENQITENKRLQTQERYNLEYNNYQAEVNLQAKRNALLESSIDSISNIFSTVSDLYEDNTEEQKGFAVASAVIDTIASAVKSFKNLGGWPTGLIGIASSLATGYAQIKSILSVNANGNNAESALASDTPNVTSTIIPNEILSNALGTSSEINLQDELAAAQKATKVYVLESDITETQNAVKTQVEESTF